MSNILLRCRKCRANLNEDCSDWIVSSHSEFLNSYNVKTAEQSCSLVVSDVYFVKENCMPKWISDLVNEGNWCKGKLTCPRCSAKLGSFDFVSGGKCQCNRFTLPPIHLVKSKVDYNLI